MAASTSPARRTGVSLARGPIALLGLAGIVFGVIALVLGGNGFGLHVPHGSVGGGHVFGLFTNGWTDLLFLAAGLLLVLGSRAHWLAKSAGLIVALALGAAAVIAVIRGNGVFGIFAANHRTEIVWGAAAIGLVLLSRLGRVGGGGGVASPTRSSDPAARDLGDPGTGEGPGSAPLVGSR